MRLVIYGDFGGSGGYIRYCIGLLNSDAIPKDFTIWFFASKELVAKIKPSNKKIHIITHPWLDSKYRILRYLWLLLIYPYHIMKINPDLEFYPTGHTRFYIRKPKSITTCHNQLLFNEYELSRIHDSIEQKSFKQYKKNQIKSLTKSYGVIFLTNYSKTAIIEQLPSINQSKVIYHGFDPFFSMQKKRKYELGDIVRLLYVSPFFSYKNQFELIKAVVLLRQILNFEITLELIGGGDSQYAKKLPKYLSDNNLHEYIKLTDNVDNRYLYKAYSNCDIFVMPSSCETFGITILEAMGMRLPIACSNNTSFTEIVKDAALFFNPFDIKSISDSIKMLIENYELRKTLGEKAFEYSRFYTWKKCATNTYNFLRNISNEK